MKQKNNLKKVLFLILFSIFLCGLIIGCTGTPTEDPDPDNTTQPNQSSEPETPSEEPNSPFKDYKYQDNLITLQGYDVAADETVTYTYEIPAETYSTIYSVIDAYNEVYKVPVLQGDPIVANTIVLDQNTLKIDFTDSIYGNYGSGAEAALIANLFLAYFDNIPEVEEIYISVDGKPYETGHMIYNLDEAITRESLS